MGARRCEDSFARASEDARAQSGVFMALARRFCAGRVELWTASTCELCSGLTRLLPAQILPKPRSTRLLRDGGRRLDTPGVAGRWRFGRSHGACGDCAGIASARFGAAHVAAFISRWSCGIRPTGSRVLGLLGLPSSWSFLWLGVFQLGLSSRGDCYGGWPCGMLTRMPFDWTAQLGGATGRMPALSLYQRPARALVFACRGGRRPVWGARLRRAGCRRFSTPFDA